MKATSPPPSPFVYPKQKVNNNEAGFTEEEYRTTATIENTSRKVGNVDQSTNVPEDKLG